LKNTVRCQKYFFCKRLQNFPTFIFAAQIYALQDCRNDCFSSCLFYKRGHDMKAESAWQDFAKPPVI
jgi:hypothetical protein